MTFRESDLYLICKIWILLCKIYIPVDDLTLEDANFIINPIVGKKYFYSENLV